MSRDILNDNTEKFFKKSIDNPSDSSVYYENKYIHIYIVITELDVYKNLCLKYDEKIEYQNSTYTREQICQYVFMKLFRFLFYLDFLHDFANISREGNILFKNLKQKEKKTRKDEIISMYNNVYKNDIDDIRNFIFKKNIKNIDKAINLKNFINLEELDNIKKIKDLSENNIKETVIKIINFFDINEISIIDEIKNCGQTFDDVLRNIDNNANSKNKIEIFVDADKSKFSLYPIIMKICSVMFDNFNNISKINYNKSMLNSYDSATTSALMGIINQLKKLYSNISYVKKNLEKIETKELNFSFIKIMFKMNRDDSYEDRFIELTFKKPSNTIKPYVNINRFFTVGDADNENEVSDSSVSAVSYAMNEIFKQKLNKNKFIDEIWNESIDNYFNAITGIFNIIKFKNDDKVKYNTLVNIYDEFKESDNNYDKKKTLESNFDKFIQNFYNDYILDSNNDIISSKEKVKTYFIDDIFVLNSYFKTIGDFAQMMLVYQLQKINNLTDNNSIYLFLSFDKISSYISSIFNPGTLKEENNNPLLPLKFFNRNFIITNTNVPIFKDKINKFGKSKSSKQVLTYGIPKNELSKRRINSLISLAKKYKITLDNHTYKNLKRLHKLQVFAKSKRIPITYKNNNDVRKYKTLNRLEKEIKEYIKRTKHKK